MENIVAKAKEHFGEDLDYIIDVYDMSIVWASEKTLSKSGYTKEQFLKMRIPDLVLEEDKNNYRDELNKRLATRTGTTSFIRETSDKKKVKATIDYFIFEADHGHWMAAKIISTELIS